MSTKTTAATLLAGALLAAAPALAGEQISGRASVLDGNTIEIDGTKLRLDGIIAPESAQQCGGRSGGDYPCGEEAAYALDLYLSESGPTTCDVVGRDRYDRSLANCLRSDGSSVNGWMVAMGWAVDWQRGEAGRFTAEQQSAKSRQLGVWQGQFSLPCASAARGEDVALACPRTAP